MQNIMLNDGTVRCADCFDASTYACMTDEPCLYCGHVPSAVTTTTTTDGVSLDKPNNWEAMINEMAREEYHSDVLMDNLCEMFQGEGGNKIAVLLYRHLSHNCLNGLSVLLTFRDCFNNDTQTLDFPPETDPTPLADTVNHY
jgi:hypothetical protein